MPLTFHEMIHQLFQIMLKLKKTPATLKRTLTGLIQKMSDPNVISNHTSIGLVPTIYEIWTTVLPRLITEHAETRHILIHQMEIHVIYLDFDLINAFGSIINEHVCRTMLRLGHPTHRVDTIEDLSQGPLQL